MQLGWRRRSTSVRWRHEGNSGRNRLAGVGRLSGAGSGTGDGGRVVIAGGGIAGLEALFALRDLAEERAELSLVAPNPEFLYRPETVEEPFSFEPAERHELGPVVEEHGGTFIQRGLAAVHPGSAELELDDGSRLPYDFAILCIGARTEAALPGVPTLGVRGDADAVREAVCADDRDLALVVPSGVVWSLPIYEMALMADQRRRSAGEGKDRRIAIFTPESDPLILFGSVASAAVSELLFARGIEVKTGAHVRPANEEGLLFAAPGGGWPESARAIALPVLEGPGIAGLPEGPGGFIPIDGHARVNSLDGVYAAGDATTFPIKQGGLGTQQADAAAEHIASRLGAPVDPKPFHPVLRGKLITGGESMSLRHDLTGGHGEGAVSADYLWWPPRKVGGRYLAPWLSGGAPYRDLEPPASGIDVEVALPAEWHEEPMMLDPETLTGPDP